MFYSRNARETYTEPGRSVVIAASRIVNRGDASPVPAEGDVKDKLLRVGECQRKKKQANARTFWAVKYVEILQVEDGYAAEGRPHVVVLIVDPWFFTLSGKFAR